MNRTLLRLLAATALLALAPAAGADPALRWTSGNKQGVGTATALGSRVWFTLGDGALSEVYYPSVDRAATRRLQFVVTDGHGLLERESELPASVRPSDPRALAFEQTTHGRAASYRIVKTTITDPARDSVLIAVRFEPAVPGLRLFVAFEPALDNARPGSHSRAERDTLIAFRDRTAAALVSSAGFIGQAVAAPDRLLSSPTTPALRGPASGTGPLLAELRVPGTGPFEFTLALGFGTSPSQASRCARASLGRPFADAYRRYVDGWHAYLRPLTLPGGRHAAQGAMAAMLLKAHEDKTQRGAIVASLSIPWGDAVDARSGEIGGYHLVWSRDLYHVATALLTIGDRDGAARALDYLLRVQQRPDGSFPQNSWLDGRPFWPSLQLDEVAFPILLAQRLGRTDAGTWRKHVRPAAELLLARGPATPQERWEEESGYSPAALAAQIAGLVAAAEIARQNADVASARRYLATADAWAAQVDAWTVTRTGPHSKQPYFVRIAQDGRPDAGQPLELNNGGGVHDERAVVDAGFLELVRLGIRAPHDPVVLASLAVVDRVLRKETPHGPGFYRYNGDGYGEKPDGAGWDGTGVGRLWPLLSGERGEHALALGQDARPYLEALAGFANHGLMLPEQVWDRPDSPRPGLRFGEGTGSATPLVWACAGWLRLALGIERGAPQEVPEIVRAHFSPRW